MSNNPEKSIREEKLTVLKDLVDLGRWKWHRDPYTYMFLPGIKSDPDYADWERAWSKLHEQCCRCAEEKIEPLNNWGIWTIDVHLVYFPDSFVESDQVVFYTSANSCLTVSNINQFPTVDECVLHVDQVDCLFLDNQVRDKDTQERLGYIRVKIGIEKKQLGLESVRAILSSAIDTIIDDLTNSILPNELKKHLFVFEAPEQTGDAFEDREIFVNYSNSSPSV